MCGCPVRCRMQIVHNRQCVLSNQPAPKDLVVDWALGY